MSWLNFNDSLNNIKGQITNFASGVLTEANESGASDLENKNEELKSLVTSQSLEIETLRKQNEELQRRLERPQDVPKPIDEKDKNGDWSWSSSNQEETSLKNRIQELEEEKSELVTNLEQLDLDCQQTIEKIVNLKDALQSDYNNLKIDYEALKQQHVHNKEISQQSENSIDDFERELKLIRKENENLSKENESLIENNNQLLKKIGEFEDLKKESDTKIKEHENSHLIDQEEYKKLAHILQGYEEQVKNYKNQCKLLQSENEKLKKIDENLDEEALHKKYVNLVLDTFKKFMDYPLPMDKKDNDFSEFVSVIEVIFKLLLDLKWKSETLQKEVDDLTGEKTKILTEKNFEIEKLLQNSEILSQEVITKSQSLKHYECECSELMKNNDLLIAELDAYKNNSGLQTISESNEDNLLFLESQLETANKKIKDLELTVSDLESSKQDANLEIQIELDYIKKQLNLTGTELSECKIKNQQLTKAHEQLQTDYCKLQADISETKNSYEQCRSEKLDLNTTIDKIQSEFENTEFKYSEMNMNMETLTEENETLKLELETLNNSKKKLEVLSLNFENKYELLRNELEDLKQELTAEIEMREQQEIQIRNLTEKLQNAKMLETGLKLQYDTVCKELQNVTEIKQNFMVKSEILTKNLIENEEILKKLQEKNLEENNTDGAKEAQELTQRLNAIVQERDVLKIQIEKLNETLAQSTLMITEYSTKINELESNVRELTSSRNELIASLTNKHHENVQYHNEIQRLNQVLSLEIEKSNGLKGQLEKATSSSETDEKNEKLSDQNNFLREKCEILAQNLLEEQSKVQKVLAEKNNAALEKEISLRKELERLRAHLIEIEEIYTKELLQAETKNQEMLAKVNEIEQREKESNTLYTSVNIRTNQQVETMQTQLQLVTNQRDELRKKISDYEDQISKQSAALANLQFVLEQFQKDKEKDIYHETERIRRKIIIEKQTQQQLQKEIINLKSQLEESKQGLLAASRLSDQVESSKRQVANMKDEVTKLEEMLHKSEAKCSSLTNATDAKVDKMLIKNLVVGFVSSNTNLNKDQHQILKLIATVLDFSQQDNEKVNVNKPQSSWLTSILQPQNQDSAQESLSQAFVRFLENESKPRRLPNLLDTANSDLSSSNRGGNSGQTPILLSEIVLPTFADFGQNRNSSSILKDVLKDNN